MSHGHAPLGQSDTVLGIKGPGSNCLLRARCRPGKDVPFIGTKQEFVDALVAKGLPLDRAEFGTQFINAVAEGESLEDERFHGNHSWSQADNSFEHSRTICEKVDHESSDHQRAHRGPNCAPLRHEVILSN